MIVAETFVCWGLNRRRHRSSLVRAVLGASRGIATRHADERVDCRLRVIIRWTTARNPLLRRAFACSKKKSEVNVGIARPSRGPVSHEGINREGPNIMAKVAAKKTAKSVAAKKSPATKAAKKPATKTSARKVVAKKATRKAAVKKSPVKKAVKKAAPKKAAAKTAAKTVKKAAGKKVVAKKAAVKKAAPVKRKKSVPAPSAPPETPPSA
jgi:hypothetical protein